MLKRIFSIILGILLILLSVLPVNANSLDGYRIMTVTVDATGLGGAFDKKVEVLNSGIPAVTWNDSLTNIVNNIMTQTDRDNVSDGKYVTAKLTIQSEDYDILKANYDLTNMEKAFTNLISMDIKLSKVLSSDKEGADVISSDNITNVSSAIVVSFDEPVIPSGKYIKSYKLLHLGATVENIACDYKNHKFVAYLKDFSPYVFYYELADKPKERVKTEDDNRTDNNSSSDDKDIVYIAKETPVYIPVPYTASGKGKSNTTPVEPSKGTLGRRYADNRLKTVDDMDEIDQKTNTEEHKDIVVDNPVEKPEKSGFKAVHVIIPLLIVLLLLLAAYIFKKWHDVQNYQ